MKRYIIGRILFVIPIMLILSFFTFTLTYLSPSDPITLKYERMGAVPDKALVEAEKEAAGLNDPFLTQYWNFGDGEAHSEHVDTDRCDASADCAYRHSSGHAFGGETGNVG